MNIFIIILTIVLLTMIYYYSLIRYVSLHICDHDYYIKKYRNVNKCVDNRVIISMTTTPDRIKNIKPVILSLLDQTTKVDQIALNIPYKCNEKKYIIPEEYSSMVNIFRTNKDYGPGTKFIPTILRESECDTIFILVNDDIIYGKDFIETLLNIFKKNPGRALISNEFILLKSEFIDTNIISSTKKYIDDEWIKNYIKVHKDSVYYDKNLRSIFFL
jgi:hypothetical protein